MNEKPEALRLAEILEAGSHQFNEEAADELRRLHAENEKLLAVLEEAEYALDYASDMTKPEGLSGCDCPICSVSVKVRAAIAKATGETK